MATARMPLAAHTDPRCADDLADEITTLCGYLYAGTYRLLTLIREFDERRGWEAPGLCSCAHWLNFKCGIGINAAREKVRVAHALKDLPKISAAFERGEVSYSKVRAMTRIATAENEEYLLQIAHHGTAYHVEKLVQKVRRVERLQDAELANAAHAGRYLEHRYDADGSLVLSARLPAEAGALIVRALEKAIDAQFRQPRHRQTDRSVHDVSAERREQPEPIAARRADAIAEIAETYLASEGVTGSSGDRYQVVVHVSAETPDTLSGDATHIENGPYVSAETSRRLGCDCSVLPVIEDKHGESLSIGRKSRSIPPAIRRALKLRDGGCRFPGCTHDRFTDGHHIRHWADGGETSLENLVLLCRHHHRLVHEGGYDCERTRDNEIVFTAPDEERLPHHAPLARIDDDPYAWFERELEHADINAGTCTGDITDLTIDWHLAVAPLVPDPYR